MPGKDGGGGTGRGWENDPVRQPQRGHGADLCTRCLYLESGRLIAEGTSEAIIDAYEQNQVSKGREAIFRQAPDERYAIQVLEAELLDGRGGPPMFAVEQFSPLSLRLRYVVRRPIVGANLCVWVNFRSERLFITFDTDEDAWLLRNRPAGEYEAVIRLPTEMLKAGRYAIGLDSGIVNAGHSQEHQRFDRLIEFEVREAFATSLKGYAPHRRGDARTAFWTGGPELDPGGSLVRWRGGGSGGWWER